MKFFVHSWEAGRARVAGTFLDPYSALIWGEHFCHEGKQEVLCQASSWPLCSDYCKDLPDNVIYNVNPFLPRFGPRPPALQHRPADTARCWEFPVVHNLRCVFRHLKVKGWKCGFLSPERSCFTVIQHYLFSSIVHSTKNFLKLLWHLIWLQLKTTTSISSFWCSVENCALSKYKRNIQEHLFPQINFDHIIQICASGGCPCRF